jgi:hypothetical protein
MRLTLIATAAMLLLADCQSTPTDSTAPANDPVAAVQNAARKACAFLPTAETVAGIIKAGDPRLATASAIAAAICDAINPATPAGTMNLLFKPAPTVDGVVIRGERVGK